MHIFQPWSQCRAGNVRRRWGAYLHALIMRDSLSLVNILKILLKGVQNNRPRNGSLTGLGIAGREVPSVLFCILLHFNCRWVAWKGSGIQALADFTGNDKVKVNVFANDYSKAWTTTILSLDADVNSSCKVVKQWLGPKELSVLKAVIELSMHPWANGNTW